MQKLIFTNDVVLALRDEIAAAEADKVFVLADKNTVRRVVPLLHIDSAIEIVEVAAGDGNKTLDAVAGVWKILTEKGATRRSLLVNVGGGMVTDLGGFAAATFKRGIRFINLPTTLLGAVDAAVGGKTGINFMGLKNQVGSFCEAISVIVSTCFFGTLPTEELLSGYAEMLKHGLISSENAYRRIASYDVLSAPLDGLLPLLKENVEVKSRIVADDPYEKGLRKSLNLGHTAGHAMESLAMKRNESVAHGFAVAHGLLVEMIISHIVLGFPSTDLHMHAALLRQAYASFPAFTCDDYRQLLGLMRHDKKNRSSLAINFTLLHRPGLPEIDCEVPEDVITAALDIYRDLLGM